MNAAAIEIEGLIVEAPGGVLHWAAGRRVQSPVVQGRRRILAIDRLRVALGEVLGVLGPNGAGKSTLLKCLIGMVRPTSGSVSVLGQSVARLRSVELTRLRRRVASLAQVLAPGSEMPLTLREVVAIGRTGRVGLLRRLGRDDWRLVDDWIDHLGLRLLVDEPYGVLSGGEQRKTLLAMAMVQEPEVLLLDEPTANLDAYWREQIVATLERLHDETDLTIVLVSHDLEALPPSTRRVLILHEGRAVAHGPGTDVLTPEQINDLYGPGFSLLHRGGRFLLVPGTQGGCA